MFGKINKEMINEIGSRVQGAVVWALGTGADDSEARMLSDLGAKKIYAVDKGMSHRGPRLIHPQFHWNVRIRTWECNSYFDEFEGWIKEEPEVIFVKWPDTNSRVSRLLRRSPSLIYIGRNDKITACGSGEFWIHLFRREIDVVIEGSENDLIVYGEISKEGTAQFPRCREEEEPYISHMSKK